MDQIEYNKKKIINLFTFLLLSGFLALTEVLTNYNDILTLVISVISVFMSIYLCYIFRYNLGLFLVMIFITYTNYSICVGVYLDPSIRPQSMYAQFTGENTYGIGITCIYIFLLSLILLSYKVILDPHCIDDNIAKKMTNVNEYNEIIAWFSPIVFLIVFFANFTFNLDGTRGGTSALGEYRIIIFIIGSFYSGRKTALKYVWTIVIVFTSFLVILSKNRVESFPPIIFLIIFWYPTLLNYKKTISIIPFFIMLMVSVGSFRSTSNAYDFFHPIEAINIFTEQKLTYDSAIYAYIPAMATIELSEITSLQEKFNLLIQNIIYVFKIGVAGTTMGNLSIWSREYYIHCYGFISPIYFYFWFGYLGAFLFACLVNLYRKLYLYSIGKEIVLFKDKLAYLLSLFFISNVARWYTYGPFPLLRGMFVFFVAFIIVHLFDTITSRRIDNENSIRI